MREWVLCLFRDLFVIVPMPKRETLWELRFIPLLEAATMIRINGKASNSITRNIAQAKCLPCRGSFPGVVFICFPQILAPDIGLPMPWRWQINFPVPLLSYLAASGPHIIYCLLKNDSRDGWVLPKGNTVLPMIHDQEIWLLCILDKGYGEQREGETIHATLETCF